VTNKDHQNSTLAARHPVGTALASSNLVECAPFRFHPQVRVTGEHGARPHLPNGRDATRAAGGHLAPMSYRLAAPWRPSRRVREREPILGQLPKAGSDVYWELSLLARRAS
jgi:hypothetical protein